MPIATRTFTVFARERVEMKRKQIMGSDEDKCDHNRTECRDNSETLEPAIVNYRSYRCS